jgi:hypothetical protein
MMMALCTDGTIPLRPGLRRSVPVPSSFTCFRVG